MPKGNRNPCQRHPKENRNRAKKRALDQKLRTFDFAAIYYTLSTLGSPKGHPNSSKKGLQNGTVFLTSKSKPRGPKRVPKGTPHGSQNGIKFNPWLLRTPLRPKVASEAPKRSPSGAQTVPEASKMEFTDLPNDRFGHQK